jgi:hypothetical protein
MFRLWWRLGPQERRGVWTRYGWFSGLMLCGSCFGVVAWLAWMFFLAFNITNRGFPREARQSDNAAESMLVFAQMARWLTVYVVTYAIEFLCLSAAKLLVLDRMAGFTYTKARGASKGWVVWSRVGLAAVVAGNLVGLAGNIASAVYFQRAADYYSAASAAYFSNNTSDGYALSKLATQQGHSAMDIQSLQSFCEVAVLLLIIVAFAVVGVASYRRINSALLVLTGASGAEGRYIQRQIMGTAAFVFVTFLLRAVYSTMFALANAFQNISSASDCSDQSNLCSSTCFNQYRLMQLWIGFTPEFQLMIVFISSPLSLLVALWGMTSNRTLQLMRCNQMDGLQISAASASMLQQTA